MLITLKNHEGDSKLMSYLNKYVTEHIFENRNISEFDLNEILNNYSSEIKDVTGVAGNRHTHGWKPATLKFLFQMDEFTIFFPGSEMLSTSSGIKEGSPISVNSGIK